MKLTVKELEVLNLIKECQNEPGHSEFLSEDVETKSIAGVVSSLQKKGMIYNAYDNWSRQDMYDMNGKLFQMWCLTYAATDVVGTPEDWY
jgi:hypothetical protein